MGDSIFSNMMVFGAAWQKGLVPLSHAAIVAAIDLNGAAVERNLRAFEIGRWAVLFPADAAGMLAPKVVEKPKTLAEQIAFRADHLVKYQDEKLATKYSALVESVRDERLKEAVAKGYHKLLSYKDEYEVARLHLETRAKAEEVFDGDFRMKVHLSPPLLAKEGPNGRPMKTEYGACMMRMFPVLAKFKRLRGTAFDPFGRHPERKMERALIAQYEADMADVIGKFGAGAPEAAIALAELPLEIRGFGPVKIENEAKAAKRREALLVELQQGPLATAAE
jgi:indolepyruvate ferredoxin oxidoreductase